MNIIINYKQGIYNNGNINKVIKTSEALENNRVNKYILIIIIILVTFKSVLRQSRCSLEPKNFLRGLCQSAPRPHPALLAVPILDLISVQLLDAAHHNINEKCTLFL